MPKFPVYLCLLGILFGGCRKFKEQATSVKLDAPKVSGNKVSLKWSALLNRSLTGYMIVKKTDTLSLQAMEYFHVDKNTTEYTDTLSLSPYAQYTVYAQTSTGNGVSSNMQLITRSDIDFIHITPLGVVVDKETNKAYIYSATGDIALCDLATKKATKQIATNATTGHCCLGVHNGRKELYVPRKDGWIFIYDAATLDQVDQVSVAVNAYSVLYSNDRIIISENEYSGLYAYNRTTKARLTQGWGNDKMRMALLPGAGINFVGVRTYGSIARYNYTETDGFVYNYYSGLPTSGSPYDIVDIFPDGKRIIASSEGVVMDTALNNIAMLPRGDARFTSFSFNPAAHLIHASCTTQVVQTYNMESYQLMSTKGTRGYPVKVIDNNGTLLSISTARPTFLYDQAVQDVMYTFIEQL